MEPRCECEREADGLNRRDLIRSSLVLAGVPWMCCDTEDIPAAGIRYDGPIIMIDLKLAPGLRRPGSAAKIVDPSRKLNLIVVHAEKNRFAALNRSCTHGSAPVALNRRHKTVQCTCWGHSEYGLDGTVLAGPAKRPLQTYEVRRAGDRIEILLKGEA